MSTGLRGNGYGGAAAGAIGADAPWDTPLTRPRNAGFNGAMTEVLAQKDAYLEVFEATITSVMPQEEGNPTEPASGAIALDRTAFFPGGGGHRPELEKRY